ncbi:MAG: hypothetical protein ACOYJD_04455 [Christensenellales bacterium]|jgi:hypothetical protein
MPVSADVSDQSYLDETRESRGDSQLKEIFIEMAQNRRQNAQWNLNDSRLTFPTFFILMPEIEKLGLYQRIGQRNIAAAYITLRVLKKTEEAENLRRQGAQGGQQAALRWMLTTGESYDGTDGVFDQVMDAAAALLLSIYRDTTVLPLVARLMFMRNRAGRLIHDIAWCFFKAGDIEAMRIVASYLESDNEADVDLACKLLHTDKRGGSRGGRYEEYMRWYEDNAPYAYFSGESFQQTSEPEPLFVNNEAKYLQRRVSALTGQMLRPLNRFDQNRLAEFRKKGEEEKRLLAQYSAKAFKLGAQHWSRWMTSDINRQITAAREDGGENV